MSHNKRIYTIASTEPIQIGDLKEGEAHEAIAAALRYLRGDDRRAAKAL